MPAAPSPPWLIEPLSSVHQRDLFACGKMELDEYLRLYAMQNQRKNVGRTFVALRPAQTEVKGYYTLSSGSVAFEHLPEEARKGLPRYPVPVIHMGRLAVALDVRRRGLGMLLLVDALWRIQRVASDVGVCGMEVNALDDEARNFYLKYGFIELADDRLHLYLPIKVIKQLLFPQQAPATLAGGAMSQGEAAKGDEIRKLLRKVGAKITRKFDQELAEVRSLYEGLAQDDRAKFQQWLATLSEVSEPALPGLGVCALVHIDNRVYNQDGEVVSGGIAWRSAEVILKAAKAWDKGEEFTPGALGTF